MIVGDRPVKMKVCECGCGLHFATRSASRKYYSDAHKQRAVRDRAFDRTWQDKFYDGAAGPLWREFYSHGDLDRISTIWAIVVHIAAETRDMNAINTVMLCGISATATGGLQGRARALLIEMRADRTGRRNTNDARIIQQKQLEEMAE
jgi:hypothetical protein